MIYTVTLNPAVDYVFCADEIKTGEINRAAEEAVSFGGKGINVSTVLRELGVKSRALGFIAGFTGDAIEHALAESGIETDFVRLERGFSRINIKVKSAVETELNGRGPEIPPEKLEELYRKLERLREGDTVILAGSIPPSLPADIYEKILERLQGFRVRAVVDTAGEALRRVLKYRPFLVKPNHLELGELFGKELEGTEEIVECAGKLKSLGAVNVLVSRAGEGAVLLDGGGAVHVCGACRGRVVNSVGAGDSMVAGFLAGCQGKTLIAAPDDTEACQNLKLHTGRTSSSASVCGGFAGMTGGVQKASDACDYEYALRLGIAAGSATAFSQGLAKREEIFRLLTE